MIINESDLKGTDYKISKIFNKQIYSFSELLNDMASNEYSRLENYYKDKFEFIKFKDEEVIVENSNKDKFIVFGKNSNGFFTVNKNKEVWLIPFRYSDIQEPLFINSSLHQFRCCYCLLLSVLFYALGKGIDKENAQLKLARSFEEDILKNR